MAHVRVWLKPEYLWLSVGLLLAALVGATAVVAPGILAGLTYLALVLGTLALTMRFWGEFGFVITITLLIVLQNILIMSGTHLGDPMFGRVVLVTKELFLLGFLGLIALMRPRSSLRIAQRERWLLVLGGILAGATGLTFLVHHLPVASVVFGLRSLTTPILFYLLGRLIWLRTAWRMPLDGLFLTLACALALYGFVEAYMLPQSWAINLGLPFMYAIKGLDVLEFRNYGLLPNNFFFTDLDGPIRRMTSFIYEPLSYGYIQGTLLLFIIARTFRRGFQAVLLNPLIWLLGLSLLLNFGRGPILFFIIGLTFLLVPTPRRAVWLALLLTAFGGSLYALGLIRDNTGGTHILALLSGFSYAMQHPLGLGIGSAGFMAQYYLSDGTETTAANESFVGMLGTQLGMIGLIAYLIVHISIAKRLLQGHNPRSYGARAYYFRAAAGALIGLNVSALFTASSHGFLSCGLVYMLAGMMMAVLENDLDDAPVKGDA